MNEAKPANNEKDNPLFSLWPLNYFSDLWLRSTKPQVLVSGQHVVSSNISDVDTGTKMDKQMSLLTVIRKTFHADWTISALLVYNKLDGYAVEDEIRDKKVDGETAIPYGVFPLGLRISPTFSDFFYYSESLNILVYKKDISKYTATDFKPHELIWIKDIPGFQYVLLHWGNTDDDTRGCLIVGRSVGTLGKQQGVLDSRNYYMELYPKIYKQIKQGGQTIEYRKAA